MWPYVDVMDHVSFCSPAQHTAKKSVFKLVDVNDTARARRHKASRALALSSALCRQQMAMQTIPHSCGVASPRPTPSPLSPFRVTLTGPRFFET